MKTQLLKSWVVSWVVAVFLSLSAPLNAFTNGSLGSTSSGAIAVSLNVANTIKLFNLSEDINLEFTDITNDSTITSKLIKFTVREFKS